MRLLSLLMISVTLMSCEKHRVAQVFEQYLWQKRVVLVFAPSEESSLLAEQRQMFDTYQEGLKERDVVRWVVVKDETVIVDKRHQPHMPSSRFYRHFNVDNKTFTVIVLGKDGTEKLRQQQKVIPSDQLFALIDSMPMRKKEIEERKRS